MLTISLNNIDYVKLSYELYKIKKDFFVEISLNYIHPIAKQYINVTKDNVTDVMYLMVNIQKEYLDLPLTYKIDNPKNAYMHMGMVIDMCYLTLQEHLSEQSHTRG